MFMAQFKDASGNLVISITRKLLFVNGFHAKDNDEWQRALERLIQSPELRARFGAGGRSHVEERYSLRAYQENYVALMTRLAAR